MFRRLLPQEYEFYDLFEEAADHAVSASKLLLRLTQDYSEADPLVREIEAVEHACDDVVRKALERLNKCFITPLDREDIHELILTLDDVADLIDVSASRMLMFHVSQPTTLAINLAKQIVRGCEKMTEAVHGMRSARNYEQVTRDCIAIHEVENAADDLLQDALTDLFSNVTDPVHVNKWKDIYETMELVTDKCEDVANVLSGVIVKMT